MRTSQLAGFGPTAGQDSLHRRYNPKYLHLACSLYTAASLSKSAIALHLVLLSQMLIFVKSYACMVSVLLGYEQPCGALSR